MPGTLLILEGTLGLLLLVGLFTLTWRGATAFRGCFGTGPAALLLMLVPIQWVLAGRLPFAHGNELVNWQSSLVGVLTGHDMVGYPHPSGYFNLSTSLYGLVGLCRWVLGGGDPSTVMAETVLVHGGWLLWISRALSSILWIGVVGLTIRMALEIHGERRKAFVAGLVLWTSHHGEATAFSPYPLALALVMGAVWSLSRRRSMVLSGAMAGAALAAHYLAVLALPVLWVVHRGGLRSGGASPVMAKACWYRHVAMGCLAGGAAFLACSPQTVFFPQETVATLGHRLREFSVFLAREDPGPTTWMGHFRYLGQLAGSPMGWMATLGGVVAFRNRRESAGPWRLVLALLVGVGLLSLSATQFNRYLIFWYPWLSILAAGAVPRPSARPLHRVLVSALALACLVAGGGDAWRIRGSSAVLHPPFSEMVAWSRETTVPGDRVLLKLPWAGDLRRALEEPGRMSPETAAAVGAVLEREMGVPVSWWGSGPVAGWDGRQWLYEAEWIPNRDEPEAPRDRSAVWSQGGLRHRARLLPASLPGKEPEGEPAWPASGEGRMP